MNAERPTLLLTRPEPQARRFARDFATRFGASYPVLIAPLIGIRPLAAEVSTEGMEAVVFTSENAVAAYAALVADRSLPAWCVGARTAAAAAAAGFRVRAGPGDGAALAEEIRAAGGHGPLLHPRGRHVAGEMAERLDSAGIETKEVILYDQEPLPLTAPARALLAGSEPVLLPLFSPRSARLLAGEAIAAPLLVAAMSPAVAEAARPLAPRRIEVAVRPEAEAMLDALGGLIAAGPALEPPGGGH